jgi:hypothetical protein
VSLPPNEPRHRKGYVNSREFFVGSLVVLIGLLLAYAIILNFLA